MARAFARTSTAAALLVLASAVLVRVGVGLHGYSGKGDAPKYGDYEAQRHWMELAVNLPAKEWYVNTPRNDLNYWGLDYPPLSGYQSLVHGLLLRYVEPAAVALGKSRGYETESSKVWLRLSVLISDLSLMFPAVCLALRQIYSDGFSERTRLWALTLVLLNPALVLIDHGHFQYNCISLGFTAGAIACLWRDWQCLGSVLYVLALNHKHMSLYYSLAFFSYLLGTILQRPRWLPKLKSLLILGSTVVLTFALVWLPFLWPPELALQVLRRLVPVKRGVFEDYVANFWCVTHVVVKWKRLLEADVLVKLCTVATVSACIPSVVHQLVFPSKKGFLISLLNCSLGFYLFSYQVHEKSILLACLPAALLTLESPACAIYFAFVSTFSMFPLLVKDGLVAPYGCCLAIYFAAASLNGSIVFDESWKWILFVASVFFALVLNVLKVAVEPPLRFPYLFDLAISAFAFVHFLGFYLFWNIKLWKLKTRQSGIKSD